MKEIKDVVIGDFFAFKCSNGLYQIIFCTDINKKKSPHHYEFAVSTINQKSRPEIEQIRGSEFFGKGNRKDFEYDQDVISKMWSIHSDIKPYFLGTYSLLLTQKSLISFQDRLHFVGKLPVIKGLSQNGNGSMNSSDVELLDDLFSNRLNNFMDMQGQNKFKIEAILYVDSKPVSEETRKSWFNLRR